MSTFCYNDQASPAGGAVVLFARDHMPVFYLHMVNGDAEIVEHWREDDAWAALVLHPRLPATAPGACFRRVPVSELWDVWNYDERFVVDHKIKGLREDEAWAALVLHPRLPAGEAGRIAASPLDSQPPPDRFMPYGTAASARKPESAEALWQAVPQALFQWAVRNVAIVAICADRRDLTDAEQKMLAIGLLAKENERLKAEVLEINPNFCPAGANRCVAKTSQEIGPGDTKRSDPQITQIAQNENDGEGIRWYGYTMPPEEAGVTAGVDVPISIERYTAQIYWDGEVFCDAKGEVISSGRITLPPNPAVALLVDKLLEPPATSPAVLPDSHDADGKSWRDRPSLL